MKFVTPEKSPVSKTFLKLGSGSSATGVFRGEPEVQYQVFENGKYRIVPSTDPNGLFRFVINFIVKENGLLTSKIFQGNWHDYQALKALHEEFDLESTYVKISQTGERQTKRMSFMPMTKQKPDQKQLQAVALQPTGKSQQEQPPMPDMGDEYAPSFEDEENIPF